MRSIRKYLRREDVRGVKFRGTDDTFDVQNIKPNFKRVYYTFRDFDKKHLTFTVTLRFSDKDASFYISDGVRPILFFRHNRDVEIHISNMCNGIRDDITVWPQLTSVPSKYYYGLRGHVIAHCGYMKVHQWFESNGVPSQHYASCEICGRTENLVGTIPIERIIQLNDHVMTHDIEALMPYF